MSSFCAGAFGRAAVSVTQSGNSNPSKSFITAKRSTRNTGNVKARPYRRKEWWARDKPTFAFTEYNIFHINAKIIDHLHKRITSVDELVKELASLSLLVSTGTVIEKISASQQAKMLRRRIVDMENTFELMVYRLKTEGIVESYRTVLGTCSKSFILSSDVNSEDIDRERKLSELTTDFMRVARDYINIDDLVIKPSTIRCPACDSINLNLSLNDDHIYVCNECGAEIETLDSTPTFKDTDRVNMSSKYSYSRKGHFLEAKKRYQGIQNTDPSLIQSTVDTVLKSMADLKLIPEQGMKKSVTKDLVYNILSDQDLSKHYDDINLIFHIITGVACPQFTPELDMALDNDFIMLDEILEQIKGEKDTNSLNVNFKLLCLLRKNDFPCEQSEFYILKTEEKKDEHVEKMQEAFDILGWEWPL